MGQARLPVGEIVAGKYRVERTVGEGGMGVVLAAQHLHLQRPVALKLLRLGASDKTVDRFTREAQVVAQLHSDHVPQVIDIDRLASGEPYIVMELLEGRDLSAELAARGPLPVPEAVDYLVQACEAISQAHALGVVHRDLKPANLFLTRGNDGAPCIKVLDFGIAKLRAELDAPGATPGLTRTGSFLGSPAYMSPEQWTSARSVDPRSDVWSLGAILFELLSGRPPFLGESMGELCNAVMNTTAPSLRSLRGEVPVELEAVVQHCLAKAPAARCQSPIELVDRLRPFAPPSSWPLVARLTGGAPGPPPAGPTAIAPTLTAEAPAAAAGTSPSWGTGLAPLPGSGSVAGSPSWSTGSAPLPVSAPSLSSASYGGGASGPGPSALQPIGARSGRGLRAVLVVVGLLALLLVAFFTARRLRVRRPGPLRAASTQGPQSDEPSVAEGPRPPAPGPGGEAGPAWARPGEPPEMYFRALEVVAAARKEMRGSVNTAHVALYRGYAEVKALNPDHPGRLKCMRHNGKELMASDDIMTYPLDKPPPSIPFDEHVAEIIARLPRDAAQKLRHPELAAESVMLSFIDGKGIWQVWFVLPPSRPGTDPGHVPVRYDLAGNLLPRQTWSGRE
jgi:eukaryotic-like serine/threonine-protein kinase